MIIPLSPPPPPPNPDPENPNGFASPVWQRWFSKLYNYIQVFQPKSGSIASTSGVAATLLTLPNTSPALYNVIANIGQANDAINYSAFAIIASDGTTARVVVGGNAVLQTITLAGLVVKSTQSSGGAQTIFWSVAKIG